MKPVLLFFSFLVAQLNLFAQNNNDISIERVSWMNTIDYTALPWEQNRNFEFKASVKNIGLNNLTGVRLLVQALDQSSAVAHSDTSAPVTVLANLGDTLYTSVQFLPDPVFNTHYTVRFSILQDSVDEDPSNNFVEQVVQYDREWKLSEFVSADSSAYLPAGGDSIKPFCACVAFEKFEQLVIVPYMEVNIAIGKESIAGESAFIRMYNWNRTTGVKTQLYTSEGLPTEITIQAGDINTDTINPVYIGTCMPNVFLETESYLMCACSRGSVNTLDAVTFTYGTPASDSSAWMYDEANDTWSMIDFNPMVYLDFTNVACVNDVEENIPLYDFSLFPNPANERVMVTLPVYQIINTYLYVYNSLGQTVYCSRVSGLQHSFSTEGFDAGVYYVSLSTSADSSIQKLIITR